MKNTRVVFSIISVDSLYMQAYTHTHACTDAQTHARIHTHTHARMHTHADAHGHTHV